MIAEKSRREAERTRISSNKRRMRRSAQGRGKGGFIIASGRSPAREPTPPTPCPRPQVYLLKPRPGISAYTRPRRARIVGTPHVNLECTGQGARRLIREIWARRTLLLDYVFGARARGLECLEREARTAIRLGRGSETRNPAFRRRRNDVYAGPRGDTRR